MKVSQLLGIPVTLGTREELLSRVLSLLETGGTVATVNATMLEHARSHPAFHKTLSGMSLCIPDGQGVARALQKRGEKTDALAGVELGLLLLTARQGLRLAIYGGREGVAQRAGARLQELCPSVELVYIRDGYHHTPFEVARELSAVALDLVYVCLGSPKQEEVVEMLSRILPHALLIGLGGSLDIWCGDTTRAPGKMREMGLEWLYRMWREPHRIVKIPALISFEYHTFLERLHTKSTKRGEKT